MMYQYVSDQSGPGHWQCIDLLLDGNVSSMNGQRLISIGGEIFLITHNVGGI